MEMQRNTRDRPSMEGKRTTNNVAVDRLSELPEPIVHQLLSLLPCKDVKRAIILSKKWNYLCSSFPILDLDETAYGVIWHIASHEQMEKRDAFPAFVDESILRFLNNINGVNLEKFRLYTTFASAFAPSVDRWISFAVHSNAKELNLHLGPGLLPSEQVLIYSLPPTIFQSDSITVLRLRECMLIKSCSVMLPRLKTLSLASIKDLDDGILSTIFTGCPLIEYLIIKYCPTLISISISGLDKLKFLKICICRKLGMVSIEAPSLESFDFSGNYPRKKIRITKGQMLKHLSLRYVQSLTDKNMKDFILQFPLLESLSLENCKSLKNVTISSWNLINLVLTEFSYVVGVEVNTPKLARFDYSGYPVSFASADTLSLSEANISLELYISDEHWFTKVKKFLESFNQCKVLTLVWNHTDQAFIFPRNRSVHDGSPTPNIVHLKVRISCSRANDSKLMNSKDGFLPLFPCLKTISINSSIFPVYA